LFCLDDETYGANVE
jgi:hypothetical protein